MGSQILLAFLAVADRGVVVDLWGSGAPFSHIVAPFGATIDSSVLLLVLLAGAVRGVVADPVGWLLLLVLLKGDPAADELVVVFERVVVEELCALLRVRRVVGGLDFSAR